MILDIPISIIQSSGWKIGQVFELAMGRGFSPFRYYQSQFSRNPWGSVLCTCACHTPGPSFRFSTIFSWILQIRCYYSVATDDSGNDRIIAFLFLFFCIVHHRQNWDEQPWSTTFVWPTSIFPGFLHRNKWFQKRGTMLCIYRQSQRLCFFFLRLIRTIQPKTFPDEILGFLRRTSLVLYVYVCI